MVCNCLDISEARNSVDRTGQGVPVAPGPVQFIRLLEEDLFESAHMLFNEIGGGIPVSVGLYQLKF